MNNQAELTSNFTMQAKREMFIEIYQKYRPSIFNYIFYRTGDPELADDLTSDVFVRLVDKYKPQNQNGRPIAPWLYSVARNLIIDHQRRAKRIGWQSLSEHAPASEASNPIRQVEQRTMEECLMKAMEYLTEEQRQVILLKFIERRSNLEIGEELGKPEGAIKSLQYRALAGLRRALEKESCNGD
jgi:RNA polymerase sigma-70 factor (ECF subfamily)